MCTHQKKSLTSSLELHGSCQRGPNSDKSRSDAALRQTDSNSKMIALAKTSGFPENASAFMESSKNHREIHLPEKSKPSAAVRLLSFSLSGNAESSKMRQGTTVSTPPGSVQLSRVNVACPSSPSGLHSDSASLDQKKPGPRLVRHVPASKNTAFISSADTSPTFHKSWTC